MIYGKEYCALLTSFSGRELKLTLLKIFNVYIMLEYCDVGSIVWMFVLATFGDMIE